MYRNVSPIFQEVNMFRIILVVLLTVFAFSAVAIAGDAPADTTNWWDEIILNIPNLKLGTIGLDTDENVHVIADEEGIAWDVCGSLNLGEFKGFHGDIGISKSGVGFLAVTRDIITLDKIKGINLPSDEYVKVNVGIFAGRDFDGKTGGIDTDNGNIIFGAIVNFLGF